MVSGNVQLKKLTFVYDHFQLKLLISVFSSVILSEVFIQHQSNLTMYFYCIPVVNALYRDVKQMLLDVGHPNTHLMS